MLKKLQHLRCRRFLSSVNSVSPVSSVSSVLKVAPLLLATVLSPPVVSAETAHYVVLEAARGSVSPLFYSRVELAQEPVAASSTRLQLSRLQESAGRPVLWIELVTAEGQIAYRDATDLSAGLRGEFHGEDHGIDRPQIDGRRLTQDRLQFVVRLPILEDTTLRLSGAASGEIELASLEDRAADLPHAQISNLNTIRSAASKGSSANRADFLILGEGYTASQRSRFEADANRLERQVFSISPLREYLNYAKISRLFIASAESGADHPPFQSACNSPTCCSDSDAQTDPRAGDFVDTALDGTFCTANIHRLVTVDVGKALAAAAAQPNWDQILVLVNDPVYGGSGGFLAVGSLNSAAVDVMQHELGHSFTQLADEYETANPGTQQCREAFGSCEPNVTDLTQRTQLKWAPWVRASTPIPTPGSPAFSSDVGLFEGARYLSRGQFRPRLNCQMRSLGAEFCEVCAQEYVLRLFRGGFGVPGRGIDPIEPRSESPRPGNVDAGSEPVNFSVQITEPGDTAPLKVSWTVDGEIVPGVTGASFTFTPDRAGTYTVELIVDATTPWVHPEMAGSDLINKRSWTVISSDILPPLQSDFDWSGARAGEAVSFTDRSTGERDEWLWDFGDGETSTEASPSHVFETAGIFPVELTVTKAGTQSSIVQSVRIYSTGPELCSVGADNLCLGTAGRFKVETLWRAPSGTTGVGRVVPFGSNDSGLLQFFGPDNWELLVKTIDACGFNQHHWVFAAATTDVEYALRVTDTDNGSSKEYLNAAGNSSPAITDIEAFATCDVQAAVTADIAALETTVPREPDQRLSVAPADGCTPGPQSLCLLDGDFEVTLTWRDPAGNTGSGSLTPARSDTSGALWFFAPDNWEMLIKVIDGCALNDRFWVFAASPTDVETRLRVRHVASGEVLEYFNPLGQTSAPITDTRAFAVCE